MNSHRYKLAAPALVLVAACGGSPTSPTPPPPPPPAPIGDFPIGSYTAERPAGTVPAELVGSWNVSFDSDATGLILHNGATSVMISFRVTGQEIRITDLGGPGACPPPGQSGTYRWSLANQVLSFTDVDDECSGRRAVLTTGPWTAD